MNKIKPRKIPYYLVLGLLTIGASLILGFLSFGGMYALWPVIPAAIGAFVLSVAYEYEIYFQNIKNALKKLTKNNYIERELSNEFLLKHFPENIDEHCPQFFRDYKAQLELSHKFSHKRLNKESQSRQKHVDKTLRDMEKWFATQLFAKQRNANATAYERELTNWLDDKTHHANEIRSKVKKRQITSHIAKAFSTLAGLFMLVGSSYLLVSAFSVVPALAAIPYAILPAIILPMAVIAGAAYSMLIYNAITDMIANDSIRKWFFKIRDDWRKGHRGLAIFIGITAALLGALAITLTICTAGTWWTIAKNAKPIFAWMTKMPTFIMGIINPIIIGISSITFNWQNTTETLSYIYNALKKFFIKNKKDNEYTFLQRLGHAIQHEYQHLLKHENHAQIFNPFRIFLKAVILPIRIIMFIGHLISVGVGDDRVPGIPEQLAAILGTTSEIFEDAHYFFDLTAGGHHHGHAHHKFSDKLNERLSKEHSHNHNVDLPSRILKLIFSPVYLLAALWDFGFSHLNNKPLTFTKAWMRQWGIKKEKDVQPKESYQISDGWIREHAIYRIERHKIKQLQTAKIGKDIAHTKVAALSTLQGELRAAENKEGVHARIEADKDNAVYKIHRFFSSKQKRSTETEDFVTSLSNRVTPLSA